MTFLRCRRNWFQVEKPQRHLLRRLRRLAKKLLRLRLPQRRNRPIQKCRPRLRLRSPPRVLSPTFRHTRPRRTKAPALLRMQAWVRPRTIPGVRTNRRTSRRPTSRAAPTQGTRRRRTKLGATRRLPTQRSRTKVRAPRRMLPSRITGPTTGRVTGHPTGRITDHGAGARRRSGTQSSV